MGRETEMIGRRNHVGNLPCFPLESVDEYVTVMSCVWDIPDLVWEDFSAEHLKPPSLLLGQVPTGHVDTSGRRDHENEKSECSGPIEKQRTQIFAQRSRGNAIPCPPIRRPVRHPILGM